jgi:hypothetical protein
MAVSTNADEWNSAARNKAAANPMEERKMFAVPWDRKNLLSSM